MTQKNPPLNDGLQGALNEALVKWCLANDSLPTASEMSAFLRCAEPVVRALFVHFASPVPAAQAQTGPDSGCS